MTRSSRSQPAPRAPTRGDRGVGIHRLPIAIVSGLPRAGTSLLLQMLEAGGLPVLHDGARPPDPSNPRGYFEWEPARRLPRQPDVIRSARGHAVKVISALLPALPVSERYRVLFAERDPREIEASQRAMLIRMATERREPEPRDDGLDAAALAAHVARIRGWLEEPAQRETFSVLFVAHRDVIAGPRSTAERLRDFLAPLGAALDVSAMAAAVDPALYRVRRR